MSSKILQFPKRTEPEAQHIANACIDALRHTPVEHEYAEAKPAHGLHLVKPGEQFLTPDYSTSQQEAARIVLESRQDMKERPYFGSTIFNERSPQFWATLPVPESHMETPLTVARRLAHLILSSATPA